MCISFHYFEEQATAIILDADTVPAEHQTITLLHVTAQQ